MKKFLTILSAVLFTTLGIAQDKGIQFDHNSTWKDLLAKAKQEKKLIVLDAFTSWCGPCRWMAKNVFTNDTVAEYYNKTFVCAKIDMEKGEGPEIAKQYAVRNYPTLLYINGDGELIHRTCGVNYNGQAAMKFIEDGKTALDPDKSLSAIKKKYDAGKLESAAVPAYLNMLQSACMSAGAEAAKYLSAQPEKALTSRANWNIIRDYVDDPNAKEFVYLVNNNSAFASLYTKDSVDMKILETNLRYYQSKKDWVKYPAAAEAYINRFAKNDANMLNSISWTFYERVEDKAALEKAEVWAKRATELNDSYAINDTYACVLFKEGKKAEAQKAADHAIELAKKNNEDYKSTQELLDKIKAPLKQ